ncbi:MAG: EAL domain-containing protein, partial [Acidobacteriota bacterium]
VVGYQGFDAHIHDYDEMVRTIVPEDANTLEGIRSSGHNLIETSKDIVDLKKQNIRGIQLWAKRRELEANEATFLRYVNDALAVQSAEVVAERENVTASIDLATRQTLTITALTFMLATFSGFYISFLTLRRIRRLKEASEKVGNGKLDIQIDVDSRDEIGDLSRSFNQMVGDLKRNSTERQRAAAEREVISEIVQGVATTENLDELLGLIHRSIGRVLNADNCYVALYDASTDLISVPFWTDKHDTAPSPAKLGTGLTAYVLKRGVPMLITPDIIRELTERGDAASVGTDPAIWLGVPLKTPEGTIGAFVVQHYEDENAYSLQDAEFLSTVGDQIALAIERKTTEDETRRLNLEIARQGERLTTIIGNVQGVVWETKTKIEEGETSLRFDFVSEYIETMLGYSVAECVTKPEFWLEIIHPDDRKRTEEMVRTIFARGKGGAVEFRWIARDGHEVWIESRNTIIRDAAGKPIGLRGIAVDISDRKSLEQQLTHQALHDPLTKLGNRVLFRDRVEHAIDRTARKHAPIAVLFLDLDNFKSVNDSLGHEAGDELLISVTERLQACLRVSDTPARFGGDEFAILLEDLSHVDQAGFIAERIRNVLCAPFSIAGTEVFIGSSIGIAITIDGHETPEELLRNADVAMYMSKSNGKNRYTVFEDEMHDVVVKRVRLESDMRAALDNGEFEVYYQPILDLQSEKVMGMEALVRWNHPKDGLILPLDFIPLAEETGLIVPLGRWIMEEACAQTRTWQNSCEYGNALSITVNVASRQFRDDSLEEMVMQALEKSQLPPKSLILEITESTMLSDAESTIKKLNDLKKLGIRFAIDDFGTGYSSLSYLQRFPVDILKIDKSFVDTIAMNKEGAAVAKAIITMSEILNLKTIAEGIESGSQQTQLQKLGCELGQGYHFAKPLRATKMAEFLRRSLLDPDINLPILSTKSSRLAKKLAVTV